MRTRKKKEVTTTAHLYKHGAKIRHVKDREKIVKDGRRKKRSMKAHREENEETSNRRKPVQKKKLKKNETKEKKKIRTE